ncbi:MAG: ATP-binding protein [Limnohabitans sp.]
MLIQLKRRMPIGKRNERDIFFLSFTLSAIVFLIPIGLTMEWAKLQTSAYTAYAGIVLSATCIGIWRYTQQLKTALLIYEFTLLAIVLVNAYFLGGITSPVMVWLGIVPLLPLFIANLKWAYVFLGLAFMAVLLFYGLAIGTATPSASTSKTEQLFAAIMFCTFIMAQMVLLSTVHGIAANRLRRIANDNKRLKTLTEQLSLAHEHKDKFLSSVSHEMRTPLNVIQGYLELLHHRPDLTAEANEQIAHARNASTHMLSLINDLLDYSQIHQGQFTLAIQPVELPALIEKIFNTLKIQASKKNLEYINCTDSTLPLWVQTDPTRLTQILLNLLSNSIKFTHQGQVQLCVSYTQEPDKDTGSLHMTVSDTGIGIPATVLNKIYTPFYQLNTVQPAREGHALQGNGLGLAITHSLVQNWQGHIEANSQLGEGTTFKVTIPMKQASQARTTTETTRPTALASKPRTQRILVVDDHAMNRMVASATIHKHLPDFLVEHAENGQQALQKMAVHLYDVVLLDIVMPDLSGIDVLQTVRQTYPEPYRNVHTIAFTANVEASIKTRCEQSGFNGFLSKPFNAPTLIQMLNQLDQRHPVMQS